MKRSFSLIILFASLFAVTTASAQSKKFSLSLGLEGGLPVGAMGTGYSAAAGSSLRAQYNINEKISVFASGGGIAFLPKNLSSLGNSNSISAMLAIPIKVGGKYFLGKSFYGSAEIGTSINRIIAASASGGGGGVTTFPSYTAMVYAPGIGVQFGGFDFGIRYETHSKGGSSSFLGARFGFNLFSIK
jgi:hypothetical protein